MTPMKNYKRNLFTLVKSCPFVTYTSTNSDKKPKIILCTTEESHFLCLFVSWWGGRKCCQENSSCFSMLTDTNTPCLKEGKLSAFYKVHEPE